MLSPEDTKMFEDARPKLMGLAYRILGTVADAEDAVQDTYLKWFKADRADLDNPGAWLTTVCTRRCLDILRAAHNTRVNYVGAWLPEPIQTVAEDDPEGKLELASSLTTAFMLMLERLSPKERAAYLLHDIFDISYPEIAMSLDIREDACRKLVSRAKRNVEKSRANHALPLDQQDRLLAAFQDAIQSGQTDNLSHLLSDSISFRADSGGKVESLLEVLHGKAEVLAFLSNNLHDYWANFQWVMADINGARGYVLKGSGLIEATASFAYDEEGLIKDIFIMRNPDKLAHLEGASIH